LVALARASATGLDTGVAGLGTTDQILAMQIAQKTGAKFKIIPYKGGGPVMTDLVGGQIQLATSSVSSVIPMVKAGRVRALAVSTSERWPSLPDVPTIAESGVAGVEMTTSMGIAGPAGMSRAVIDRLNSELNFVLGTREVSESLLNAGLRAQAGTPESYYDALKRSHDQYGPLIKSMGIKVD
jgi:tripartite-type tricarboxylate transporter receptor subunit TctC